jgi:hypothetical protein
MKRFMLAIGLFAIGLSGCTEDDLGNSLNGSWTVFSIENVTTGTIEYRTQENSWDKPISIQFDDSGVPNIISGVNTTNRISGHFSFAGPNRLSVSNLVSTYAGQPRWADEFLDAMGDQNLTFITTNDKLVISYNNETRLMTLRRD